jgi:hypothetical protein
VKSKAIAVALIVFGLVVTALGLFGQVFLNDDEGHHDGRPSLFALQSELGTDELIVEEVRPNELVVSVDRAGQPIQTFDEVHDAPMHVFAVTPDLSEFHHDDPDLVDGVFEPVSVGGGEYRVVVQTAPDGGPDLLELGADVSTTGDPLSSGRFVTVSDVYELPGGLTVERQGFDFVLSEPWQGEDHHGGPALLTMFRAEDGAFVHAHAETPSDNRFRFNLNLPGSGEYLAALEFLRDGRVETALYRFEV